MAATSFFFPNFIHSRKRLTLRTTIWKQQSRPQFFQHNWTNTFKNAVLEVVLSLTVKQCVLLLFLVKSVRQQGEKYAFLFFPPRNHNTDIKAYLSVLVLAKTLESSNAKS